MPTQSKALTAEPTIMGPFQYMAPEQLEGKEADAGALSSAALASELANPSQIMPQLLRIAKYGYTHLMVG